MFICRQGKASKKSGYIPLQCRININGKEKDMGAGIKVHPDYWDRTTNTLKANCPDYDLKQKELNDFKEILKAHFKVLQQRSLTITPEQLKAEYYTKETTSSRPSKYTLLNLIDEFILEFEKKTKLPKANVEHRSAETLKQWKATRNKLIEYLTYKKTGQKPFTSRKKQRNTAEQEQYIQQGKQYDMDLRHFEPAFAEEFYLYLTVDRNGEKLEHRAANKQVKNTKQIFTHAVAKGILTVNPIAYYRTADEDSDIEPLEDHEIQAIINATDLIKPVARIRDCFVAQIYTGFAFQDLEAMNKDNIYQEPSTGVFFLCRERGKTGIDEMVPITPIVKEIMDIYKNDPECQASGQLFPVPSNQNYNGYLKILQLHCKIENKLHTHLARHTFAHIMLNHYGFSLEIVSRMLGHKTIRSTQKYCKISMKRIAEAFAPHLIKEREKPAVIISIETCYRRYGIAA